MTTHRTAAECRARRNASWLVAVLCALSLATVAAPPADAQTVRCADGSSPRPDPRTGRYVCADGSTPIPTRPPNGGGGNGGGGGGGNGGGGSDVPPPPTAEVRIFERIDENTTCTLIRRVVIPEGSTAADVATPYSMAFFRQYEHATMAGGTHEETCPFDDPDPLPDITTPDVWAVFEGQLGRPDPAIVPGRMLTGLTSYLETNRTLEHTAFITIAGMTLEVRGTATYTVDWGDGTVTGPHDTAGEPYPHGTVNHVYIDKGTYTVQVTDTWTMEWRFEGGIWTSPLATEMAPVSIEDFVVNEYRAVRTSSS